MSRLGCVGGLWRGHVERSVDTHLTGTYLGSWMNLVENFFGIITRQAIRRGTSTSVKGLIAAIEVFVDGWDERCQPFMWTKTADEILAKAKPRKRLQTRDSRIYRSPPVTE